MSCTIDDQPAAENAEKTVHQSPGHRVANLIETYYASCRGELCVGGVAVGSIAERYGTPLFLYDRGVLDLKWEMLQGTLPTPFAIYYSIKANPNQSLLKYFLEKGCGLEIASAGELHQALKAGCPPAKIIFAGPGKTNPELELALSQNVGEIHVESVCEAERVALVCRQLGKQGRVALRINPSESVQGGAMRMGGKAAPFGIDEEELDAAVDRVLSLPELNLKGIHLYSGTQILDEKILIAQYRKAVELATRVADRLQRPLETIDFGGGFGVPYFAHERPLDMQAFARELMLLTEELKQKPFLSAAKLVVEPGRFLVAEAGLYVARVIEVKRSRGKWFVIVDGGMHHHLAASGNLGQTIKRNYPVALLGKLDCQPAGTFDVVGPLCTPLDVLARNVPLPQPEPGDLFGIFQSGAYARTASPLGFLGHAAPPEVWVETGSTHLIRVRGNFDDPLRDQRRLCSPS